MNIESEHRQVILVLDDIEETLHLTEKMLGKNGCCITVARNEEDAIARARSEAPDLMLMSVGSELEQRLATAHRIRQQAAFGEDVAIVIFCVPSIPEGAEMEVKRNIYVTRPDNFDQLRNLVHRLLQHHTSTC
ncbi:response regulator [Edaphobacter aggregans]|uniref:response regulator n=1 Tax=Edaphobacter aggregans TaxID=570835 RepID=UPI0012FA4057|nr:response regulator [Edaphobacter aggregans]